MLKLRPGDSGPHCLANKQELFKHSAILLATCVAMSLRNRLLAGCFVQSVTPQLARLSFYSRNDCKIELGSTFCNDCKYCRVIAPCNTCFCNFHCNPEFHALAVDKVSLVPNSMTAARPQSFKSCINQ